MNLTALFIKRHVATVLLTVALSVTGIISYFLLPVSPLPQVDFPTISVTAFLPGASPKTMATSVATPLERAIGTIAGITEMTSFSGLGMTRVTVQFDLDRDIDGAARDVQSAINNALSNLPSNMPSNPTYRQVNPADAPIMAISLTSDTIRREQLYDFASTLLAQKISQIDGVGQVDVGGGSLPAVRVTVNTDTLHQYGLGLEDVSNTIRQYNPHQPLGSVEDDTKHWQITANDQAHTAEDYRSLVISWKNGMALRLGDVAHVGNSVQDIRQVGLTNGKPSVALIVYRKPGANIIAVTDTVRETLPQLRASIPSAVDMTVTYDSTITIRSSLHEVMTTLYISVALVIIVVFLFLGNLRATLIPGIATTASLVGTFAGMYLCRFSLDNLSLMALAIATGFVVDDAIVVLENISRHMEEGLSPLDAAIKGAREVSFTVISISLSLIAVFIPILFMGGIVGRLFREFAVTLSIAIAVSLVLSLTLTPMLCAYLLRHEKEGTGEQHAKGFGALARWIESFHAMLLAGYRRSLHFVLRHRRLTLCVWLFTVALTLFLYIVIPKGFFPEQDTGRLRGSLMADTSISFQSLRDKLIRLMGTVQKDPDVETVIGFTGSTGTSAFVSVGLKPRKERQATATEIIARLRSTVNKEPGVTLFLSPNQDINVGGRSARAMYQYTLQTDDLDELYKWTVRLQRVLRKNPIFKDLNNDLENTGLQSTVTVDRDTATRFGVTLAQVDRALNDAFGQAQISTMYRDRNQYRVVMMAEHRYWQGPDSLKNVYVPGKDGILVPLTAFAQMSPGKTPVRVNHQGQTASATISFNLTPGASLSQATESIQKARREINMPPSIQSSFQGTAKEFVRSLQNQPLLICAAILCLYIVLGILYESLIHPITILSTLPPASIGALVALRLFGMDFSVIALIGVLLLAGIVKKNAIMLVDFAIVHERTEKATPEESITRACELRFRPIMMTTMAAILGAVPLAIGFGDGSELRRPLGVSIIGGLVMSQLLTLYTTPVLYLYLDKLSVWWKEKMGPLFARMPHLHNGKEGAR
ncbi:MAG: efflux RND transporter permease subunit [Burkholderiaceae bacterium]|jgi:multidrug efflux pump|nr:efflux RND transporter permease subunit [Burkholderiaceae bacterium]